MKTVAGLRKTRHAACAGSMGVHPHRTAYNLVRMPKLVLPPEPNAPLSAPTSVSIFHSRACQDTNLSHRPILQHLLNRIARRRLTGEVTTMKVRRSMRCCRAHAPRRAG